MDEKDEIIEALKKAEQEGDERLAKKRATEERIKKHIPSAPAKQEKKEHPALINQKEEKRQLKEFIEVVVWWSIGIWLLLFLLRSELEKYMK